MGYQFFSRRSKRNGDDAATEFAETEATLPPSAPASNLPFEGLDEATPSDIMDSRMEGDAAPDSRLPATAPARSLGKSDIDTDADADTQAQPTLSHVGRYALKSRLGEGGLGQVHEAWDPLLSRTVAVKTLQFDLPTPLRVSLNGMILNEARAAASLNHAYIVTVFDAGLSPHGVYIAMERLQGRDMRQALSGGWAPSPRVAAVLVRRVADALAYAHARGVVHCDIKPANIFLVGRDRPKVLDFGIARIANGTAVPVLDGSVAGSPHYQAPEQVRGTPVDARTDIYALGTVLYELLTGRKAFGGDSVETIHTAVMTAHPAAAVEVRRGVPQALSDIAARAMARDPDERFASATEMSMALRRWAESQGHAQPEPTQEGLAPSALALASASASAASRARAQRLRPALVVGGLLAAAGLGAWLLMQRTEPAAEGAVLAGEAASSAAGLQASAALAAEAAASGALVAPGLASEVSAMASASVSVSTPNPAPGTEAKPAAAAAAARPRPAATRAPLAASTPRPAVVNGTVQLAISPWGRVEVNGSPAGTAPPLNQLTLPEGTHTITVRNEDFPPFVATVQVSADKTATLRHRFGP